MRFFFLFEEVENGAVGAIVFMISQTSIFNGVLLCFPIEVLKMKTL